jgi:hypothetical protein
MENKMWVRLAGTVVGSNYSSFIPGECSRNGEHNSTLVLNDVVPLE